MPTSRGQPLPRPSNPGPRVQLAIYDSGLTVLTRRTVDSKGKAKTLEYAVDPDQIAKGLGPELSVTTGLIPRDMLWMSVGVNRSTYASYRPPQLTGIWLEGTETPLRVPLPGLILIHKPTDRSSYLLVVKEPPTHEDIEIFRTPLPNVGENGHVCWGSVPVPTITGNDLAPVWTNLLGSRFANHTAGGKSKKYPDDTRALLIELDTMGATEYPLDDLVPVGEWYGQATPTPMTLGKLITKGPWK